jgi:hypothetical protein
MLNVALIGYGYWGPNLARNLHELAAILGARLVCRVELSEDQCHTY